MQNIIRLGRRTAVVLAVASLLPLNQANADSPLAVATIAATATVGAATITAVGALGAATIVAIGNIKANEGDGDDVAGGEVVAPGTGGEKERVAGKTELRPIVRELAIGEASLPAIARDFVDREIRVTASSLPASSDDGGRTLEASARYAFNGDIKKSDPKFKKFSLRDTLTLRIELANVAKTEDAPLIFRADELTLSTKNIVNTKGHSKMLITAVQDGNVLWRWSAQVHQGQLPKIEGPAGASGSVVKSESDLLIIEGLKIPTEYKAPGSNGKTVVDFIVNIEGEGARI